MITLGKKILLQNKMTKTLNFKATVLPITPGNERIKMFFSCLLTLQLVKLVECHQKNVKVQSSAKM